MDMVIIPERGYEEFPEDSAKLDDGNTSLRPAPYPTNPYDAFFKML